MALADLVHVAAGSAEWHDAIWPRFEADVLALIALACQRVRDDARRDPRWQETHYTWALRGHLASLASRSPLPIFVEYDGAVLSEDDFAAGVSPNKAAKIDLVVHLLYQPVSTIYFGVEAKVLAVSSFGGYTAFATVRGYVDRGIQRYVDSKYARSLPAATMIGYVLNGATNDLVQRINERIRSRPIPCDNELEPLAGPVLPDHHRSSHPREAGGSIRLHHGFITFPALASSRDSLVVSRETRSPQRLRTSGRRRKAS